MKRLNIKVFHYSRMLCKKIAIYAAVSRIVQQEIFYLDKIGHILNVCFGD